MTLNDHQLIVLALMLGLAAFILAVLAFGYAVSAGRRYDSEAAALRDHLHFHEGTFLAHHRKADTMAGAHGLDTDQPHTVPCKLRTSSGMGDHGYCACWCHGGRHGA